MIMPCMNSTSACERGGSVPFVVGGSVLLGLPGAPGCTTTGLAASVCWTRGAETKPVEAAAPASRPGSNPGSMPYSSTDRLKLDIFIARTRKGNGTSELFADAAGHA